MTVSNTLQSFFYNISENQALTYTKLNYIRRLYRILAEVSMSLIGPGEDPARPLP